jgi:hypothetical protein
LDGECRRPLVFEDIETNACVAIYIGMVDPGDEAYFGGFEGVVGGEVDVQEKHAASIRGLLRTHYSRLPVELVLVVLRPCRTVSWRVAT